MKNLTSSDVPKVEGVDIQLVPPSTVRLKGTITRKDPSLDLTAFFKALHRDAIGNRLPELCVDVTELTFVNSSCIRLFIDWAVWVQGERDHRYILKFKTNRQITWQTTAFAALTSLMKDVISVERV